MYTFNSMTDEEIELSSLLNPGVYDFQVVKSTRKLSKANNPMAEIQLHVWDEKGALHILFDYLIFSQIPLNIKKVKHFCEAVGLEDQYEKGQLQEELERLSGKLELGIQDERQKEGGGFYPKKNIVVDYIKRKKLKEIEKFADDIIPF